MLMPYLIKSKMRFPFPQPAWERSFILDFSTDPGQGVTQLWNGLFGGGAGPQLGDCGRNWEGCGCSGGDSMREDCTVNPPSCPPYLLGGQAAGKSKVGAGRRGACIRGRHKHGGAARRKGRHRGGGQVVGRCTSREGKRQVGRDGGSHCHCFLCHYSGGR